jgi:hypothetical protein
LRDPLAAEFASEPRARTWLLALSVTTLGAFVASMAGIVLATNFRV